MNLRGQMFIALDQSTSATKAMLINTDGTLLDQESLPHRQIYPLAGWVEHDAEEIYQNVLKVIRILLNRHAEKSSDICALSITNQRETFVLFDHKSGKPLYNAIVWQCRRGVDLCDRLVREGCGDLVHTVTGLKVDTYFPAGKLRWLLDESPELRTRVADGTALFGTIDTFLVYRLTAGKVYASDHTNASRTLLYDTSKLEWSRELQDLFGVDLSRLPDLRESSDWFGDTDIEGSLGRRIPIFGVMGDSQAALFAQRCFSPGDAKVTFGTGSSVLLTIGHEKRLSDGGSLTALAWVLQGQPTYAFEGIINFTGAIITWLRDQMGLIREPAESESLALSVPDSGGVLLVPAFVGLSAPYWRPNARAAILGITPSTTRAHIVRAALESIGYIITDVLQEMGADAGVKLSKLHADGGATRNRFLMQFVADMSRATVAAAKTHELSALGAVFNGCLGMKLYSSLEDIRKIKSGSTEYHCKLDSETAMASLTDWKNAVQQVLYQPLRG